MGSFDVYDHNLNLVTAESTGVLMSTPLPRNIFDDESINNRMIGTIPHTRTIEDDEMLVSIIHNCLYGGKLLIMKSLKGDTSKNITLSLKSSSGFPNLDNALLYSPKNHNILVAVTGSYVISIDKSTGEVEFLADIPYITSSTMLENGSIIFATKHGVVYTVDLESKRTFFMHNLFLGGLYPIAIETIVHQIVATSDNNQIFMRTGSHSVFAFDMVDSAYERVFESDEVTKINQGTAYGTMDTRYNMANLIAGYSKLTFKFTDDNWVDTYYLHSTASLDWLETISVVNNSHKPITFKLVEGASNSVAFSLTVPSNDFDEVKRSTLSYYSRINGSFDHGLYDDYLLEIGHLKVVSDKSDLSEISKSGDVIKNLITGNTERLLIEVTDDNWVENIILPDHIDRYDSRVSFQTVEVRRLSEKSIKVATQSGKSLSGPEKVWDSTFYTYDQVLEKWINKKTIYNTKGIGVYKGIDLPAGYEYLDDIPLPEQFNEVVSCKNDAIGQWVYPNISSNTPYYVVDNHLIRQDSVKGLISRGVGVCVTHVTDMSSLSLQAATKSIETWDVSNVTNMSYMFAGIQFPAEISTLNLNLWSTSKVQSMEGMFTKTYIPSNDLRIDKWNTSNVKNMRRMFANNRGFNSDITSWNTSNVVNMEDMFNEASSFNQNIGEWDTSSLANIGSMFLRATSFNQNLNKWDTSRLTFMEAAFAYASSFNQSLSNWNTSKVDSMYGVFYKATAFNQDISMWDLGNCVGVSSMFEGAESFNQNLSSWSVEKVRYYKNFTNPGYNPQYLPKFS
ncbi:BspA family leucine-rich repeat surface protein [Cysteiniphilum litorale]|uniref:BspA family leucine-rich repeat surface protein n=1 Tax=Cysteiniphilum litorale TaxID=2056700 RepID=UPI003F880300